MSIVHHVHDHHGGVEQDPVGPTEFSDQKMETTLALKYKV